MQKSSQQYGNPWYVFAEIWKYTVLEKPHVLDDVLTHQRSKMMMMMIVMMMMMMIVVVMMMMMVMMVMMTRQNCAVDKEKQNHGF
jgi:heme/copper-type cytochrome/quinol oxidase subunit 2